MRPGNLRYCFEDELSVSDSDSSSDNETKSTNSESDDELLNEDLDNSIYIGTSTDIDTKKLDLDLELGLNSKIPNTPPPVLKPATTTTCGNTYPCGLTKNIIPSVHHFMHPQCMERETPNNNKYYTYDTGSGNIVTPTSGCIVTPSAGCIVTPTLGCFIEPAKSTVDLPPLISLSSNISDYDNVSLGIVGNTCGNIIVPSDNFTCNVTGFNNDIISLEGLKLPELIDDAHHDLHVSSDIKELKLNFDCPSYENYDYGLNYEFKYDMHGFICPTTTETFVQFTTPAQVIIPESLEDKIKRLNDQKAAIEKELVEAEKEFETKQKEECERREREMLELEIAKQRKLKLVLDDIKHVLNFKLAKFGMAVALLLGCGKYTDLEDIVVNVNNKVDECETENIRNSIINEALEMKYTNLVNDMNDPGNTCRLNPLNESTYPNLYDSYITDSYKIENAISPSKKLL